MTDVGRLWITVLTKTFMEDGMMKMDKSVLMDESEVWKLRNLNSVKRRKQMAHVMQMVMIAAAVFVVLACAVTAAFGVL